MACSRRLAAMTAQHCAQHMHRRLAARWPCSIMGSATRLALGCASQLLPWTQTPAHMMVIALQLGPRSLTLPPLIANPWSTRCTACLQVSSGISAPHFNNKSLAATATWGAASGLETKKQRTQPLKPRCPCGQNRHVAHWMLPTRPLPPLPLQIATSPRVSSSWPSGVYAAQRAEPFIFRLATHCRLASDTRGT